MKRIKCILYMLFVSIFCIPVLSWSAIWDTNGVFTNPPSNTVLSQTSNSAFDQAINILLYCGSTSMNARLLFQRISDTNIVLQSQFLVIGSDKDQQVKFNDFEINVGDYFKVVTESGISGVVQCSLVHDPF